MSYDPFLYWEARASNWIQGNYPTEEWWERIKPYVKPEWKVLELGCGTGRWAPYFPDYTGTDVSSTLVINAKHRYPDKDFFHHDMRAGIKGDKWDLIFTYTAWLHMPPKDIKKVTLPDCNYLFIEPHGASESEHCFKHNYEKLFGVKKLVTHDKLTMYGKFKEES